MDKKQFLDYLYYEIGGQRYDFYLQVSSQEGLKTKWRKYSEVCFESEEPKNKWFIENCNQRQILPCEVVLDLEDKEQLEPTLEELKQLKIYFYAYATGSRGYHIHLFFDRDLIPQEKLAIIRHFKADEQKAIEKTLIALENAKHWKSGKLKEVLSL
jgi:hypothetical protein